MNARIAYTHLLKGYAIPLPGQAADRIVERLAAAARTIGTPKDKFNATIGFRQPQWGFNLDRHLHRQVV